MDQSNTDYGEKENEHLELRAYDDFVQQSVEVGSFLNFKHKRSKSSKYSFESSEKLVLIKYKSNNDSESGVGSLRASQLQKRREIHSLLLFIFFLFVTIITLSQILVMHSSTNNSNFNQIKLMQEELKLMDLSIDRMLKENHVMPMQTWIALKQYYDNIRIFSNFMENLNDSIFQFSFDQSTNNHRENCSLDSNSLIDIINIEIENKKLPNFNKTLSYVDNYIGNFSNNTSPRCLQFIIQHIFIILNEKYSNFFEQNSNKFSKLNKIHLVNETLKYFNNSSSFIKNYLPIRDLNKYFQKYKSLQTNRHSNLSLCDAQPSRLYGRLKIEEKKANKSLYDQMEKENPQVKFGGYWSTPNCQARHKVSKLKLSIVPKFAFG